MTGAPQMDGVEAEQEQTALAARTSMMLDLDAVRRIHRARSTVCDPLQHMRTMAPSMDGNETLLDFDTAGQNSRQPASQSRRLLLTEELLYCRQHLLQHQ